MTTPASPRPRSSRLPTLTGMRFFAAFVVFLFHLSLLDAYSQPEAGHGPFASAVKNGGWAGVTFFFILSGFVLTWSARDKDRPAPFWTRRVAKIFPNHAVTFLLSLAVYALGNVTWRQGLPNLFLLQAWIPDRNTFFNVNNPSWSLSCELVFYLVFPLLHRLISSIPARHLWTAFIGVGLLIAAMPLVAELVPEGPHFGASDGNSPLFGESINQMWFVYIFPPIRVLDFALGIVAARILATGRWIPLRPLPALALAVAGYAVSLTVPFLFSLNSVVVIPFALLITAAAARDAQGEATALSGRLWIWLGEASFAFYLVHDIVLTSVQSRAGFTHSSSPLVLTSVAVAALIAAVVCAWLLFQFVEQPVMRVVSRKLRARAASPTTTAAPTDPVSEGAALSTASL
ncbi:acyltransferase family protein [Streptomyces violascens]|uniref:acyltransferase family protein n=1 Tax=Streptomyces violascens TaxID=67381 RepID=UPI0036A4168C